MINSLQDILLNTLNKSQMRKYVAKQQKGKKLATEWSNWMLSLQFTFLLPHTNNLITLNNLYQWNSVLYAVSEVCLILQKTFLCFKFFETKQQILILNGILWIKTQATSSTLGQSDMLSTLGARGLYMYSLLSTPKIISGPNGVEEHQ